MAKNRPRPAAHRSRSKNEFLPVSIGSFVFLFQSDFGDVVQREAQDYLIRKPTNKLAVGDTQRIRITVKFNTLEPAPQLVGFRLNARVVCPASGIIDKDKPITAPPPTTSPDQLQSPCPGEFTYEPLNNTDKWFGVVHLKSETQLDGVWIRISLDRETVQLGVSDEVSIPRSAALISINALR